MTGGIVERKIHLVTTCRDLDAERDTCHISCTDLDQGGGDVGVGDPAGDDQRLLLLHVQHIWAHTRMFHKWLLAV